MARTSLTANATAPGFPEGFESGTKTSYAVGTVALASGSWTFDDALIGNTTADAKTGTQSACMRNSGILTMNVDLERISGLFMGLGVFFGNESVFT